MVRGDFRAEGPCVRVTLTNLHGWDRRLDGAEGGVGPMSLGKTRRAVGWMLIDTGASLTVVTPSVRDALHPCQAESRGIGGLHPQTGWRPAAVVTVPACVVALSMGEESPLEIEAAIAPLWENSELLGLIGRDLLARWILEVDGPGRAVSLRRR